MSHTTLDPKYGDIVGFTRGGHRASVPPTPVMHVSYTHIATAKAHVLLDPVTGNLFYAAQGELSRLPEPLIPPQVWKNVVAGL